VSKYLAEFDDFMQGLEHLTNEQTDPHRKAMMVNYTRHHALEFCGRSEEIFDPAMTVDHPVYQIRFLTPDVVIYDGVDQVRTFYDEVISQAMLLSNARIAVGDSCIASTTNFKGFFTGAALAQTGVEVDDPDGLYVRECELAQFWSYTDDIRLIGEEVYQITNDVVYACSAEDFVTIAQQEEIARPFA
jgi:hypothetical protein